MKKDAEKVVNNVAKDAAKDAAAIKKSILN